MPAKKITNFIRYYLSIFNDWNYNRAEYQHLTNLIKRTKRNSLLDKTIVFNTVRSFKVIFDKELFIGKLLALNGANVIILLDDGVLKHWDTYLIDRFSNIKRIMKTPLNPYYYDFRISKDVFEIVLNKNIIKKALNVYKDQNLNVIFYSDLLTDINYKNWQTINKFAESSTIRFFKNSDLDYNNECVKYYYKLSLKNALLSQSVGEFVIQKIKPDYFVTSHGIYSTWGPAFELAKNNGIKSYVYAGKHSHSLYTHDIYFTDSKVQTLSKSVFWENYKKTPISKEMEDKVRKVFESRINHATKDTKLYYKDKKNIFKVNKDDGYKYHFVIFPSLIWDGNIKDRHVAFTNIMDWIISTINYLSKREEIKVYLKFHPAEVTTFKNSPKIQDLLKKYIKIKSIRNLELIPTEKKIDPYEFLKSGIDFGICYDGILGLEMPYLRIPALLGGVGGRFSVKDGNFTIKSREEYFYYLENFEKYIDLFHRNYEKYYMNIIRYSYWYFFENVMKLATLSNKSLYQTDLLQLIPKNLNLDNKLRKLFSD